MNSFDFAWGTHTGLVRELNEDSYLASPELGLWAVADGMGGHAAGEVASRIAISEIARSVEQGESLADAIETAHRAIRNAALQRKRSANMGATVVVAKLDGPGYQIGWVGDSRAYLWNDALHRLTKDHSYVQLLLDAGLISESKIPDHPARNIVSQGLGVGGADKSGIKVDLVSGILGEGDTLLLCSDGLTGEVADDRIAQILSESAGNRTRADRLIAAALEAGGKDNVTVILINALKADSV